MELYSRVADEFLDIGLIADPAGDELEAKEFLVELNGPFEIGYLSLLSLGLLAGGWLAETDQAQAAAAAKMPIFEVVKDWPKLPANMKVGDASSFAIDAQDNVWLIHRPHTLKGDAQKQAAKPVVVFSPAGEQASRVNSRT